jgi:uncharacterized protein (TIGR03067 family)
MMFGVIDLSSSKQVLLVIVLLFISTHFLEPLKMSIRLLLVCSAVLATATSLRGEEFSQENLLGTWRQTLLNDAGKRFINADEYKEWDSKCTITADKLLWKSGVRGEVQSIPYKLDTSKSPVWIDLERGERTQIGIIQIEDGTLRICLSESARPIRPTKFDPADHPYHIARSTIMVEFKREKNLPAVVYEAKEEEQAE